MPREAGWWMDVTPSLPLTEETEMVEGLPIYYRAGGSGPPLLLLHGGTLVGQQWNPFLDELGQHHTVIIPDQPGHGRSPAFPPEGLAFGATARVMLGLLDALGVDRVRGMGHSSGASVVLHMAGQHPGRVEALVSISGAHRLPIEGPYPGIAEGFRWENLSPAQQKLQMSMHPGGIAQVRTILAEVRGQVPRHKDYELPPAQRASITARMLLVYGDRDLMIPVEHALEAYRALPDASLWIVPGEGHSPPWSSERVKVEFPGLVHAFFEGRLVSQ